uniref:Uncharacterized protein n=1 Tax=Neospora caninum (strain Liverpool) TaxID=572307 RepID=A0A0F7ULW4_NEOCL|nr:TPA: hypothetical protein BN1204_052040 [Neospora caninum Liverpool]
MTLLQLLPERVLGAAVSTQARRVPVLVLSSAKARSAMEDRSPSLAYDAHGKTADLSRGTQEDIGELPGMSFLAAGRTECYSVSSSFPRSSTSLPPRSAFPSFSASPSSRCSFSRSSVLPRPPSPPTALCPTPLPPSSPISRAMQRHSSLSSPFSLSSRRSSPPFSPSRAFSSFSSTDAPEDMPSRGRKTRRGSPGAGSLVEDGDLPFRANSRGEDRRVWRFPRRPPGGESWRTVFAGHGMRHLAELYDSSEAPSEERREKEAKLNWFALGRVVDQNRGRHLAGYTVPYKFRIIDPISVARSVPKNLGQLNRRTQTGDQYVDFSQNRFPVLNTAENFRYWKDRGLDRLLPRVFPIKLPAHRRVDPLLREYIYFLHSMDPARFSTRKLGERYGLKERTVELICREFSVAEFLRRTELATPYTRRVSREKAVLRTKEALFSLKLGYDQLGDEDLDEQEEHEFRGFRSTQDWIQRQNIEVEMMSAFPLPAKRDPVPKRVDVDLTVHNTAKLKVMNWIDPNDKVVF